MALALRGRISFQRSQSNLSEFPSLFPVIIKSAGSGDWKEENLEHLSSFPYFRQNQNSFLSAKQNPETF